MDDAADDWYGPDAATFGDRLAAARERSGMTQKDLAKRLGIKASTLVSWEQDLAEPRANRLSMMAGILNVSIMWLLNGEGEGVSGPLDVAELPADVNSLFVEIRDLKAQLVKSAERLGMLEKRLRAKLKDDM